MPPATSRRPSCWPAWTLRRRRPSANRPCGHSLPGLGAATCKRHSAPIMAPHDPRRACSPPLPHAANRSNQAICLPVISVIMFTAVWRPILRRTLRHYETRRKCSLWWKLCNQNQAQKNMSCGCMVPCTNIVWSPFTNAPICTPCGHGGRRGGIVMPNNSQACLTARPPCGGKSPANTSRVIPT